MRAIQIKGGLAAFKFPNSLAKIGRSADCHDDVSKLVDPRVPGKKEYPNHAPRIH